MVHRVGCLLAVLFFFSLGARSWAAPAEATDARLEQKVTLGFKATALSDVCERLSAETRVQFKAGRGVADEKVTLFCRDVPLREVMKQASRPFGYTWLRSGKEGEYQYELVQDLRSQIVEEELRNRDRTAALLAVDQEMSRFRPYLNLSPDEALARAQTAPPEEKKLLEQYAGKSWGAVQLYFRLSPEDFAALRAGQSVTFNLEPKPSERPLPPEMGRSVLQSWRDWRVLQGDGRLEAGGAADVPGGVPLAAATGAVPRVVLSLSERELGQFALSGGSGFSISVKKEKGTQTHSSTITDTLVLGTNPATRSPENRAANAKLAQDPSLRPRVSVRPQAPSAGTAAAGSQGTERRAPGSPGAAGELPRVTSADVLEALHRATGAPLVADYYTRLYPASEFVVQDKPLFEALNDLADRLRLRWTKDGAWLQFRSASYYDDRLKEVPNRLLDRWAASRRQHGALTLEDLVEIAQLTEAQLNARDMAEGARVLFGLEEWDLLRHQSLRPHLRFLAALTPAQRQQAQTAAGIEARQLPLAQQQEFLARGVSSDALRRLNMENLASARLRVDYAMPGAFQWEPPPADGAPPWQALLPSGVREPAREAALQAARRLNPAAEPAQIVPTEVRLTILYLVADRPTRIVRAMPPRVRILTPDPQGGGWGEESSDLGETPPSRR